MRHEEVLNEHKILDKEDLSIQDCGSSLDSCCSSLKGLGSLVYDLVKHVPLFLLEP